MVYLLSNREEFTQEAYPESHLPACCVSLWLYKQSLGGERVSPGRSATVIGIRGNLLLQAFLSCFGRFYHVVSEGTRGKLLAMALLTILVVAAAMTIVPLNDMGILVGHGAPHRSTASLGGVVPGVLL